MMMKAPRGEIGSGLTLNRCYIVCGQLHTGADSEHSPPDYRTNLTIPVLATSASNPLRGSVNCRSLSGNLQASHTLPIVTRTPHVGAC